MALLWTSSTGEQIIEVDTADGAASRAIEIGGGPLSDGARVRGGLLLSRCTYATMSLLPLLLLAPAAAGAAPDPGAAPSLTAPAELVIRPGASAAVRAVFPRPPGEPRIAASEGTLRQVQARGATLSALYEPPAWGPPRIAVLAAWDAAEPVPVPAVVRIRLSGAVEVPVQGPPGTMVLAELSGQRFGPEQVGPNGATVIQARTAPGPTEVRARILGPAGEQLGDVVVPRPPETLKTTAILADPTSLPARGEGLGRVFVHTFQPDGALLDGPPPVIEADLPVALGLPVRVAPGLHVAAYRVPLLVAAAELTFTARLAGEPPAQARVALVPAPLESFTVRVEPDRLSPGGGDDATPVAVVVEVTAAGGLPAPGQAISLEADFGLFSPLEDRGDGTYTATYTLPALPPPLPADVALTARLPGASRDDPPRLAGCVLHLEPGPPWRVRISTRHDRVPADGRTRMPLTLEVTDLHGNPTEGEPVLRVDQGQLGTIEPQGPGRFFVTYLPPARPALDVREELRFTAVWRNQPLAIEGGLTLAPVVEAVPPARLDAPPPPGWSWLGPAPAATTDTLLGVRVGWLALFGEGLFGKAGGPSSELELLLRSSPSSPLYLGFVLGFSRSGYTTRAAAHPPSSALGSLKVEVRQSLIPLLAGARLRWDLLPRLTLDTGLLLGGLVSVTAIDAAGIDEEMGGTSLALAGELPLGLELRLGGWALGAELALTRTLTDLAGREQSGTELGLGGTVNALAARATARWRLP